MPGASAHTWVLSATSTLPQWGARGRPEAGLDGPLHGAHRRPGVQRLRVDARASCMRARRLPGGRARARPRPARPLARGPPARRRRRVRAQAPCAPQLVPHARAPRATTRVERARMLQRGAPRTLLCANHTQVPSGQASVHSGTPGFFFELVGSCRQASAHAAVSWTTARRLRITPGRPAPARIADRR